MREKHLLFVSNGGVSMAEWRFPSNDHGETKGINDYMVEIGGEIRCRGCNPNGIR